MDDDWSVFDRTAADHFRKLGDERGFAALVALADELRARVKLQHPSWPTAEDRADDHAHHLRLIEIFDRAADRSG